MFARLAARLIDGPSQPRIVHVGMPGHQEPALYRADPGPGEKRWERPEAAGGQRPPWDDVPGQMTGGTAPVHMCPDETGVMPCCGRNPLEVAFHDGGLPEWAGDPRLVTCRTSAHDTAPDDPPAQYRPYYVPEPAEAQAEPYVPDFRADYRDLPVFRATLRVRGWCGLATGNRAGRVPDFGLRRAA